MKIAKVASELITYLNSTLAINVILGFPEIGRITMTLPIGALQFRESDYGVANARRLGEVPAKGHTERFVLVIVAKNEAQLLGYVDALRDAKAQKSAVTVEGTPLTVRWGVIKRTELLAGDAPLDFCIDVEITVTLAN